MNWFESAKEFLAKWKTQAAADHAFFENFTPRASQVLVLAREEAERLNHNFIGTEHILLGLIKLNEGLAFNILEKSGVHLDNIRVEVEKINGRGPDRKATAFPFTPRAKKILNFAKQEAAGVNHTYIGAEHLLLSILREGQGIGVSALRKLNLDLKKIRKEILNELDPIFSSGNDAQKKPD
jgi:ATP-dependent Clp protease ATP-binding subunit ClpC